MRIISHILILVLIIGIYVSYCQWQGSHYYLFSAAMEKNSKWTETILYAMKGFKANRFDDRHLHLLSKALLEQGRYKPGISIIKRALAVRPHKKYLLRNLKLGVQEFKAGQDKK